MKKPLFGAALMFAALLVWLTIDSPFVMAGSTLVFAVGFYVCGGPRYVWNHLAPAKRS